MSYITYHTSSPLRHQLCFRTPRYGPVESVRLRSIPLDIDSKAPRQHAVKAGKISADRGSANAYVVFKSAESVPAALAANMSEVRHQSVTRTHVCKREHEVLGS